MLRQAGIVKGMAIDPLIRLKKRKILKKTKKQILIKITFVNFK